MSFQIKYFNCSYAKSARTGRIVGQLCLHYNIQYNAKLTKTNSELDFKNFGVKKEKRRKLMVMTETTTTIQPRQSFPISVSSGFAVRIGRGKKKYLQFP